MTGEPAADRAGGTAPLPGLSASGRRLSVLARLVLAALVALALTAGLCATLRLFGGPAVGAGEHVWLASYALLVAGSTLVASVVAAVAGAVATRRPA